MSGDIRDAHRWLLRHLTVEMDKRSTVTDLSWIDNERMALVVAANEWADAKGLQKITVDEVEAVEVLAVGHIDYATKLCFYVAEMLHGLRAVS